MNRSSRKGFRGSSPAIKRGNSKDEEVPPRMNIFQCFALWARQTEEIMATKSPEPPSVRHEQSFEGTRLAKFSGTRGGRRGGGTRGDFQHHSPPQSRLHPGPVMLDPELHSPLFLCRPEPTPRHQKWQRRRRTSSLPKDPEAVPEQAVVIPEAVPVQPAVVPEAVPVQPAVVGPFRALSCTQRN
ncbi:hypothetical protein PO909_006591 [Leuciscus waleckii]